MASRYQRMVTQPTPFFWVAGYLLLFVGCVGNFTGHNAQFHTHSDKWETMEGGALLRAGPMVGYTDVNEVMLWVQTRESAPVRIRYHEQEKPGEVFETFPIDTQPSKGCTAHLLIIDLKPATRYNYEVLINGIVVPRPYPTSFRTRRLGHHGPHPNDFTVALGSCAYVSDSSLLNERNPHGSEYEIFKSIHEKQPDLMIWLGDNFYFTPADWNTPTGMLKRYSHGRALPELQPLLGSVPQYAIWDDHDFGPNNSDRGNVMREAALDVFKMFWANPGYGVAGQTGITTSFVWEDVQFFLLDNRFFRSPNHRKTGDRTQLGKHQVQWLIDALVTSRARYKVVAMGGQFVTELKTHETYSHFHPEERREILGMLAAEKIEGVIFLSGDRHYSEVSRLERKGHYPLDDFTVSPLTSGAYTNAGENEKNMERVEGSLIDVRNFALMSFRGPHDNRRCELDYFDTRGKPLWSTTLPAGELRYGK